MLFGVYSMRSVVVVFGSNFYTCGLGHFKDCVSTKVKCMSVNMEQLTELNNLFICPEIAVNLRT